VPGDVIFVEWNDQREQHFAAHRIRPREVLEVISNPHLEGPNKRQAANRKRIRMIGCTHAGRCLTVVLEETDDAGTWIPVTGWDSTAAEQARLSEA
jgi:hypothetical protein